MEGHVFSWKEKTGNVWHLDLVEILENVGQSKMLVIGFIYL